MMGPEAKMAKATFGAGCFWGVEEDFRQVEGVTATAVGYCGGTTDSPMYEEVCAGTTGHAEVVQVDYDPSRVSYETLLELFWGSHDPTTMNRQGLDVGTQYRSAIFYHSVDQQAIAQASKRAQEQAGRFNSPIVTEIEPIGPFQRAEDYHQQFLKKRGLSSCKIQ
jgi:peptide-methionine (S)-S-oxide reductase